MKTTLMIAALAGVAVAAPTMRQYGQEYEQYDDDLADYDVQDDVADYDVQDGTIDAAKGYAMVQGGEEDGARLPFYTSNYALEDGENGIEEDIAAGQEEDKEDFDEDEDVAEEDVAEEAVADEENDWQTIERRESPRAGVAMALEQSAYPQQQQQRQSPFAQEGDYEEEENASGYEEEESADYEEEAAVPPPQQQQPTRGERETPVDVDATPDKTGKIVRLADKPEKQAEAPPAAQRETTPKMQEPAAGAAVAGATAATGASTASNTAATSEKPGNKPLMEYLSDYVKTRCPNLSRPLNEWTLSTVWEAIKGDACGSEAAEEKAAAAAKAAPAMSA